MEPTKNNKSMKQRTVESNEIQTLLKSVMRLIKLIKNIQKY